MLKIYWTIHYTEAGETYDVEPIDLVEAREMVSGLKPEDRGRGWRAWNIPEGEGAAFVHAVAVSSETYPAAPTSKVLDDYDTLCSLEHRRPGMDAITGVMGETLLDQYRVFEDSRVSDPKQAGEWLGAMVADMYQRYDEYHMRVASR